MKRAFAPSVRKLLLPAVLLCLRFYQYSFAEILFATTRIPFTIIVGLPPFPYYDKPSLVSPKGAAATSIGLDILIYVVLSVESTSQKSVSRDERKGLTSARANATVWQSAAEAAFGASRRRGSPITLGKESTSDVDG